MERLDARNRRSYDAGGFPGIFKRTARAIPAFGFCAIASCGLWYGVFHVPLERLGTVAVVPCVVGFVMMRILSLLVPPSVKGGTRPSAVFQTLVVLSVFAAFIAVDFLCSSAIYYSLKLGHGVLLGAMKVAGLSAALAGVLIIAALVIGFPELWATVLTGTLKLLRARTAITNAFLVPPWHKHWSP